MTEPVIYSSGGGIAVIALNNPPVNGLNLALRGAILDSFHRAIEDPDIRAIVLISAGGPFCGGADIREFGSDDAFTYPDLGQLCNLLEESTKPVVAAIDGVALGGGFELVLACDYRLATAGAKFGLPEVTLGIIPGAGGTQRLPRLTDPRLALDMILGGKSVDAQKMRVAGVIDIVIDGHPDLLSAAVDYAKSLIVHHAPARTCAARSPDTSGLPENFFDDMRQSVAGKYRGTYAPEQAVKAVEAACRLDLEKGLQLEGKLVRECMDTPQARAQQHLFFAEREAGKVPGLNPGARQVGKVAIIGAGTMGSGIAITFLNAGLPVTLLDTDRTALNRGLERIDDSFATGVARGRLTGEQAKTRLALLRAADNLEDVADADLVIEAVIENLEIKKNLFRSLGKICKPDAILATNTSTLDVDEIARASGRPSDVLGMHFFSPANVMRLLEIVRGAQTADDALATAIKIAKKIGKAPVVSGVCWGFIGNRMIETYGREAARLILEGVPPARIDRVLYDFGLPMGLPSMIDMAGIDVGYHARQGNREALYGRDPTYAAICDKLYELGRYGRKSGRGFYRYDDGAKTEDPDVPVLARELAEKLGVEQREIADREILERTIYMLVNEGARVLDEGIACRSGDIDVVYCCGYGFPAWRGGPMQYADEIGLEKVLDALNHYRDVLGDYGRTWFEPAPLLEKLAAAGMKFRDHR